MRTRFLPDGTEFELRLTTDSSASSYGRPVVVTAYDRRPLDLLSLAFHEVIEASAAELAEFRAAGYPMCLADGAVITD